MQQFSEIPSDGHRHSRATLDRSLIQLRRRLVREGTLAIEMLEASLRALWTLDKDAAAETRARDDRIDDEEVEIEQECFRLLTLQQPFGGDFRLITFCLKVNQDIERVADHASSIAKIAQTMDEPAPKWPVALVELGERLPMLCHELMRAVLDEDVEAARQIVVGDKVIDQLDKRLFEELTALIGRNPEKGAEALLMYRVGRELERVGDLMANIAEDIVYLVTGNIIRHEKKQLRRTGTAD